MKEGLFTVSKKISHLALIMDGNGRWAKARNKPRTYGHKVAIEGLIDLIIECSHLKINGVSLFAFSTENWKRPKTEVTLLFKYLEAFLKRELNTLMEENIKLYISGDYHKLPNSTIQAIDYALSETKNNSGTKLNICLNYGGQDEIIYIINTLLSKKLKNITKEIFEQHLYASDLGPIDLLIRTSGEERISNFMLYQLAYAEMIFYKNPFPDFKIQDLHKCIDEFSTRNRRYGGIK